MKNKTPMLVIIFFVSLLIIDAILVVTGQLKLDGTGFGIMVAAGITLALFSFLFHDNPLFKMAEHFYVGVSAAYIIIINWYQVLVPNIFDKFNELSKVPFSTSVFWSFMALSIPCLLGLLLYARYVPQLDWLSRISFAFVMGFGAGAAIPLQINSYLLVQLKSTLVPLWIAGQGIQFGSLIIFIGVLATLIYFFFSIEHKGVIGKTSRLGVYFLMVSFGASFGYTVMARVSLLIERTQFLFHDWLPLIK